MSFHTDLSRGALAALLLVGASACASNDDSFAERVEDIADDWRKGQDDVEKGQEMVADGRKDVRKAQRELDDERDKLRRVERELSAAKEAYDAALLLSDAAMTAEALDDKDSPLSRLKKRVEKAEDEVKSTRNDVQGFQKDINDGRKKIEKGEDRIKKGERQKIEAETAYRLEPGADPDFFERLFD